MNTEIILVCATKGKQCDEQGFYAQIGDEDYLFCCEKGFRESMEDFKNAMKNQGLSNDDFTLN